MAILEGKKAIIIGDRDGIPGPAIAECVRSDHFPLLVAAAIVDHRQRKPAVSGQQHGLRHAGHIMIRRDQIDIGRPFCLQV